MDRCGESAKATGVDTFGRLRGFPGHKNSAGRGHRARFVAITTVAVVLCCCSCVELCGGLLLLLSLQLLELLLLLFGVVVELVGYWLEL